MIFKVGDRVYVRGYKEFGSREIVGILDGIYSGGVKLDQPVDGIFVHWNEDDLDLVDADKCPGCNILPYIDGTCD